MTTVYFITHPEVHIDPDIPVKDWSLSDHGVMRLRKMLSHEWVKSIGSIYCSTEKKAIDGAVLLGECLQLPIEKIKELGENDRSSTGYLPALEFESVANEFFAQPTQSVRGWETAVDAQSRIVGTISSIVAAGEGSMPIAIVSHGAVGTLLLCHLNNWPIAREHDQPGNGGGNYFSFKGGTSEVIHGWLAIDA